MAVMNEELVKTEENKKDNSYLEYFAQLLILVFRDLTLRLPAADCYLREWSIPKHLKLSMEKYV